jgi:hypothetical protein
MFRKNLYPILRPLDIFSKTFSAIPPPQKANMELTPAESSQDVLLGAMTTSPSESAVAIAPGPRLSEGVDFCGTSMMTW